MDRDEALEARAWQAWLKDNPTDADLTDEQRALVQRTMCYAAHRFDVAVRELGRMLVTEAEAITRRAARRL